MVNNLARSLRKLSFVKTNKTVKFFLKKISLILSKIIYGEKKQVKIANKYEFYLDSIFAFSNYENWGNEHNSGFEKLVELSKDKNVVFDIGGHVGLCALPMSQNISKNGKVYTFEPSNLNRTYLKRHLEFNDVANVKVIDKLLGDKKTDDVEFYELKDVSGTPSIVNIKSNFIQTTKSQTTLDLFCSENALVPDLIKIDVEGAEFFVLEGSRKTLTKYHPDIMLSLHPKHLEKLGRSVEEIFDICDELGYKLVDCIAGEKIKKQKLPLSEFLMTKLD